MTDATGAVGRQVEPVLAIVVPDLIHASVTFFHEHIAQIWPGRTVVVHLSTTGDAARTDVPVVEIVMPRAVAVPRLPLIGLLGRQFNVWRQNRLGAAERRRIADFLRAHGVTHLFAEFAHVGATIAPLARRLGLPLTSMSHGWDINVLGEMPQWRLRYRRYFRSAARLVAVVPFLRGRMARIGAPADRIEVIPCAVESADFPLIDQTTGPVRVAMVSRLVDQKGPLHSVRAFALARAERPELVLEVVGNGPLMARVEAEVAALGIADAVTLHRDQPHEVALAVIARAHLFLQHCMTLPRQGIESQGVSVCEAMGHGAVAIVTRHGGLADHVAGERGIAVDEGDVAGMARAIVAMVDDPAARARIGAAARAWVLATFSRAVVYPRLRARIGLTG